MDCLHAILLWVSFVKWLDTRGTNGGPCGVKGSCGLEGLSWNSPSLKSFVEFPCKILSCNIFCVINKHSCFGSSYNKWALVDYQGPLWNSFRESPTWIPLVGFSLVDSFHGIFSCYEWVLVQWTATHARNDRSWIRILLGSLPQQRHNLAPLPWSPNTITQRD